ncbi:uncharacterized protein LOC132923653 [Rhopalosiphum padi]|uniref:uncharacterized protein LOC132923653 n=1 Tax=Rhopalosiphum padi TaxID=40932 RepID=UPI00298DBA20|nr:uncharacterized protein LOC132923653 [Rhopalosiphum padi]
MKIRFNLTMSAVVTISFVVYSVNAKPVSQDPDNQSRPTEPKNSKIDGTANTTLIMSPSNTATEKTTSSTGSNNATTFAEDTDNDTTAYTSSEKTNIVQATTIVNVEMVSIGQITENVYSTTTSDPIDSVIDEIFPTHFTFPDEYTKDV